MKKVVIGSKPTPSTTSRASDAWVKDHRNEGEPTKRLTIDVPLPLHKRIKSQCANQGVNMADVLRELLEKHFPSERANGHHGSMAN